MDLPKNAMILITGDDVHHDMLSAAGYLQRVATDAGFLARSAMGLQRFVDPFPVTNAQHVFCLYKAGGQFSAAQQVAFAERIRNGGGLVALHSSNVMDTDEHGELHPAFSCFFNVLGNRYLSHGPGKHEGRHRVHILGEHPITAGIEDFDIFDEYYEFEFADDAHQVLAERTRADGTVIPVMYAREFGTGRVVYLALGHDQRAWGEPAFITLVQRSLLWSAGEI